MPTLRLMSFSKPQTMQMRGFRKTCRCLKGGLNMLGEIIFIILNKSLWFSSFFVTKLWSRIVTSCYCPIFIKFVVLIIFSNFQTFNLVNVLPLYHRPTLLPFLSHFFSNWNTAKLMPLIALSSVYKTHRKYLLRYHGNLIKIY